MIIMAVLFPISSLFSCFKLISRFGVKRLQSFPFFSMHHARSCFPSIHFFACSCSAQIVECVCVWFTHSFFVSTQSNSIVAEFSHFQCVSCGWSPVRLRQFFRSVPHCHPLCTRYRSWSKPDARSRHMMPLLPPCSAASCVVCLLQSWQRHRRCNTKRNQLQQRCRFSSHQRNGDCNRMQLPLLSLLATPASTCQLERRRSQR